MIKPIDVQPEMLKALEKAKEYADRFGDFECAHEVMKVWKILESNSGAR